MEKVWVYFNVRTKTFSVRSKGKVIAHTDEVWLCDARFKVSEAGRQRVLATGHKNVHAYVVGYLLNPATKNHFDTNACARYNPRETATFVDVGYGTPVRSSTFVHMTVKDGKPVIGYML